MQFIATLDKSSIDAEGESTITLKIPLQYRDEALELLKLHQKLLQITIEPDNRPYYEAVKVSQLD